MWFFTADLHLGHNNIIKYCQRPFMSVEEQGLMEMADSGVIPSSDIKISNQSIDAMNKTTIDSINSVVGRKDTLVILGDFCFSPRNSRENSFIKYREMIDCQNVILIHGSHDDRNALKGAMQSRIFSAVYETYTFSINGQAVFCSHYPHRSWDKAHYGSWMLYGHVHDLFGPEDNGDLMPYEKEYLREKFSEILDGQKEAVDKLLDACASLKGIDYTLDVGVDNRIRGENISWGTPWSMDEISDYMNKKRKRWEERKDAYMKLKKPSTLKSSKSYLVI